MPDLDRMEEALHRIVQWAEAYPLDIFPSPTGKPHGPPCRPLAR
jgi:hypothetical protein